MYVRRYPLSNMYIPTSPLENNTFGKHVDGGPIPISLWHALVW